MIDPAGRPTLFRRLGSLALATVIVATGCTKEGAADTKGRPDSARAQGGARAATGAGGRPVPTISLAAADVLTLAPRTIEESIPVTGDLRPIETIEVRARLEGDIASVLVREGERVREGQLLARFEASEEASARASAVADRVAAAGDLQTAQWNHEQSQELFKAGAIAERDLRASEQAVAAARARLAAAESRVRAASSTERDTRVLAPTSGVIARRDVEADEHVTRGQVMFVVVRSDVLELTAAVPARRANDLVAGLPVRFTADNREFTGTVARVSPTIDPATRSVTAYVRVPNADGALKGGTFASGRVIGRTKNGAIVVPSAALRQGRDGAPFVYRINGSTIEIARVELGIVDEASGSAEVTSGLAMGEKVIVGNVGTLGPGMQVQIVGGGERRPSR